VQRLRTVLKVVRLALPKFAIGWMFALLTANFNRISIYDLHVQALVITTMTGLHHLLSPFQVVFGRISDRYTLFGYRRTPLLILGALVAGIVFVFLPSLAVQMSQGSLAATVVGFVLLALFGVGIAAHGDAHHALIADVTTERQRGGAIAVVWTFLIISTIISAGVAKTLLPVYNPADMQFLYNLTPFVVVGSTLLGVVGMERRLTPEQRQQPQLAVQSASPLRAAGAVLKENPQARAFFAFIFLAIFSLFLQDNILEVFGAEVFNMLPKETTAFTQTWGGGALLGMLLMGVVSALWSPSKKLIATLGGMGVAIGLGLVALTAVTAQRPLLNPALLLMGLGAGCFNVGALAMMMDMTVAGARGLYMGLWGMAQAFGTGLAAILSGALHTALIESGLLGPAVAYLLIFGGEALLMIVAIGLLRTISVPTFQGLTPAHLAEGMALEAA